MITIIFVAMACNLYLVFVTQLFISEVISSYPYYTQQQRPPAPQYFPSYKQYYQSNYPKYSYPTPKAYQPTQKLPPSQTSQPNLIKDFSPVFKSEKSQTKGLDKIDSNVLNNLAIALQLLIVNNIINNPTEPTNVLPISEAILELAQKPFPPQTPGCPCEVSYQLPNSKFLGSSNFGDDGMLKTIAGIGNPGSMAPKIPGPRSSFGLISPYDALTNSARSESLASFSSPNDFLNPYAAISATDNYKDLFSLDF